MPKPRLRNQDTILPNLDEFIRQPEKPVEVALNPNASRKFKTISLPLNEHEYQHLMEACQKAGRSEKNFLRYAMMRYAEEVLK